MPLDPAYQAMLKQLAAADGPSMVEVPPEQAREMYRVMQSVLPHHEVKMTEDADADGVPVRIYRATEDKVPCVVFFHGGGWVIGDLDTHDSVCRQLANESGYTVVAVHYRLAPEHPFPASVDDCYSALRWIQNHADDLNIDGDRIAVAGDSAGGNLAAAVSIKARDEGTGGISFQLLIYPVTDFNFDTASYSENAEGYLLTIDSMRWFWNHYVGHDESLGLHPLASPMRADDLSGLPPALIMTAEFDPLRDEGEAYGERLKEAGVKTDVQRYEGLIHGFFGQTDMTEGAREAMSSAAFALKEVLG
ncbi:MAG: alpha/beta hydrolase [Pseudomonadales bacterium]|nr:alpha/beta hydrolase [Pseudomonadales bacterium]MBO6566540.1 alpha/beta hydrolase [Pseudomonadales bacterium]MBO6595541.1 alpha/beta hydrolase [Pseudomonadales bacterium]MBO6820900.1 alpha/beta hydrolase [Pseudomonadales bacterium]